MDLTNRDHRIFSLFNPVVFFTNLSMTTGFFYFRWTPYAFERYSQYNKEKIIVSVCLVLMLLAFIMTYLKRNIRPQFLLFNFGYFLFFLTLLLVELFFSFFPSLLPSAVIKLAPQLNPSLKKIRADVVEYLSESPWVKFRPNVVVRGLSDSQDDFTHEWTTDHLGFKNGQGISKRSNMVALALGDSFVEAWGVPTDQTWTSIVSRSGFPTYNFGVQGYAPQQMVGTLRKYGRTFETQFVLFGYTPGFEPRSLHFSDPNNFLKDRVFTGGIEIINNYLKERRIHEVKYFQVLNSLLDLYKRQMIQLITDAAEFTKSGCPFFNTTSIFSYYCVEVAVAGRSAFSSHTQEWQLTEQSILEAKGIAEKSGATLAVIIFYHRPLIYYERVLKKAPPEAHYELQTARILKEFCESSGIDVIDTYGALKNYVDRLSEPLNVKKLPYFKRDGHMNEVGQVIVANVVLEYFREKKVHRRMKN